MDVPVCLGVLHRRHNGIDVLPAHGRRELRLHVSSPMIKQCLVLTSDVPF